jgi:fibronectin type III domain protein
VTNLPHHCLTVALLLGLLSLACDTRDSLAPQGDEASFASYGASGLGVPSNLTSTAVSKSRIDLTWQDNSSNETGFEVQRSATGPAGAFSLVGTTGADVTQYSDTGLNPLTEYCYQVRAFRKTGAKTTYSAFSNVSCTTTPGPPPGASNASASPTSSIAIRVAWSDNSATEDGFRVERAASATGPWEKAATTGPNVTSYPDGQRASEQQVCYRVIAFNAYGDSGPSNADCTAPPAAPTNLVATAGAQAIDLTWADNSGVEDGYQIERFPVYWDHETLYAYAPLANLPANSTSYHDADVTYRRSYSYRVHAMKNSGLSDYSNTASATYECVPKSSTEMCGNGADDDCDGVEDLFDPDCEGYCWCLSFGLACDPYDGTCVSFCADGVQDNGESDIDCGGSQCSACLAGQHCSTDSDCASSSCVNNVCQ